MVMREHGPSRMALLLGAALVLAACASDAGDEPSAGAESLSPLTSSLLMSSSSREKKERKEREDGERNNSSVGGERNSKVKC